VKELKELLLQAPEGHIDPLAIQSIEKWDDEPKAIQILETLDMCVHGGLSSGFVVSVLEQLLNVAVEREKTDYEELLKDAVWRK
jgi:hypothetical protein